VADSRPLLLPREEVTRLLKRDETLATHRTNYDSVREELATYIRPNQLGFTSGQRPREGEKRTTKLYDSVGIDANERFARSVAGGLMNEASQWLSIKMLEDELNELDEVTDHLEARRNRYLRALSQSNFYAEALESLLDLGAFGQFVLYEEEAEIVRPGFNGLRFEQWPLSSVSVAEDAWGRIATLFRRFTLSAEAVVERWDATVSHETRTLANQSPDTPVDLLMSIYPRKAGERGLPIAGLVLERGHAKGSGTRSEPCALEVRGYHEQPFMAPRWSRKTGERYGTGPGHYALPDLRSLNEASRLNFKAWAKTIDPPTAQADRGVLSPTRLFPGGVTVTKGDPNHALAVIESKSRFDVTQFERARLESKIRAIFFDALLSLPEDGPQMTAREVVVRYELMQRLFGPSLGRLMSEFFAVLITRTDGLMTRGGAMPELPTVLEQKEWTVQYESPLARAQRLGEVDSIQRFIAEDLAVLTNLYPETKHVLKAVKTARHMAERRGVPTALLEDERVIEKLIKAQADVARDQEAKADAAQLAESVGKLAPALKADAAQPSLAAAVGAGPGEALAA
jgi:hypothetical protein